MDAKVSSHQIKTFRENIPSSLFAVVAGVVVMDIVMISHVPILYVVAWTILAIIAIIVRVYVYFKLSELEGKTDGQDNAPKLMVVSAAGMGAMWAAATLLFSPFVDLTHLVFLAFFMSGFASGAVFSSSVFMPAFNAYFFPTLIPVLVALFLYGDNDSSLMGILLLVFIISAWRMGKNINFLLTKQYETHLEADVANAESKLMNAKIHALKTMAGSVAHNFNNALTGAYASTELLKKELGKSEKAQKYIESIERSIGIAIKHAKSMLDYSDANFEDKSSFQILGIINSLRRSYSRKHGIQFKLKIDCDNPLLPKVFGDAEHIKHSISELLLNAYESYDNQPDQEKMVTLRVSLAERPKKTDQSFWANIKAKECLVLEIHDNGVGMSDEELDAAFDPFYSSKFTGRGVGLSTAQALIEKNDGWLTLSSSPNEGTTATIYIPTARGLST